ncbi:hypothetical protein D3C80_1128000 [compost metagenome]
MQGTDQCAGGGAEAELQGYRQAGGGASLLMEARQQAGHAVGTEHAGDADVEQQADDDGSQAAKAAGAENGQRQAGQGGDAGAEHQHALRAEAGDQAGVEQGGDDDAADIQAEQPGVLLR